MLKRISVFLSMLMLLGGFLHAQVTTSSITGSLKANGSALTGATVKAVHEPTGTVYTVISSSAGTFNIGGMRSGGPYNVEISFVGLESKKFTNVYLTLGEALVINETLSEKSSDLGEVVITGTRTSAVNRNKTGASTNIGREQLNQLPTLNRSITDFTRITPQANGNSFGGRDGRYNNVQVDGANFNNGFGLNDAPLPGGGGLSIDAIDEIQVNIAPYDVRQGGFTGAGINAVTKSGTNKVVGSVYHFFQNEGLIGRSVKGEKLSGLQKSSQKTTGIRVGGPIIKNKLFFFVNAERIASEGPSAGAVNLWRASEDGVAKPEQNIARTRRSDLEAVRNHLINQWGYDPGAYEGYANGESEVNSILARIDWNINNKHKLTARYNRTTNEIPSLINGASGAYPRSTSAFNRVSQNSMAFAKTMYNTANNVNSYTLELNSRLSNKVSNQFLVTYSKIETGRTSPSEEFPTIDIGDGLYDRTSNTYQNYMTAGYELFTYNNKVINDNLNVFNNVNILLGKHNLIAGASFELQKFANNYMRSGTSYYRYRSVADFLTTGTPGEVAPMQFALTYPYAGQSPWAKVTYGLPAVYIQDNITFNPKFNLTIGLRAEVPMFMNDLPTNNSVDALNLLNTDGGVTNYASGEWPKTRVMLSPRVGFRYDVYGDKSLIVRGGTGIFAGRVPFVWLTNMPSNTGMIQNTVEPGSYAASAAWINNIRFNPDKMYWANNPPAGGENVFISSPTAGVPSSLALVDRNFKMPQVFRTNLGFDKRFGKSPFTVTADFMLTNDLQAVYQFGANRKAASQKMYDGRDYFATAADYTYSNQLGGNVGSVLMNTTKGYSYNFSAGITMAPWHGLSASLFYSHTDAQTTTDNSGSNASSAWGATPNRNNPNDIFLASSMDALPHRIIGTLSYKVNYLKHLSTTVSLFYDGSAQGRYSFIYNGDVNGDAIAGDLLYIPNSAAEINFVPITGTTPFTVEQQRTAFDLLMSNSKYLDKNRGSIADRNAVTLPWYNRVDFKLLQDLFVNIGKQKNSLQLSFDIFNFANFLNSDWGIRKVLIANANAPLTVATRGVNPTFRMTTTSVNGQTVLPTSMYRDQTTFGTTWSMQIGLRYNFN